jgi:hypothetical protein
VSGRRTLWEEGRHSGRLVTYAAAALALVTVLLDVALNQNITLFFDIVFVLLCVGSALAVRPRDFFVVGVFPPMLMAVIVLALAVVRRGSVADPRDGIIQALVSGLAHHAGALIVGYVLTLAILSLRQVALKNSGTIRSGHGRRPSARRTSSHATH